MDHRCLLNTPNEELPSSRVRKAKVYVDCNSFGPHAIEAAVRLYGAERIVCGTDGTEFGVDWTRKALEEADIGDEAREQYPEPQRRCDARSGRQATRRWRPSKSVAYPDAACLTGGRPPRQRTRIDDEPDARPAAQFALGRVFGAGAGARSRSCRIRDDPAPSALLGNIPASVSHKARVARPMIRRGWLERGPGPDDRRGSDEFVPVSWPEALDRSPRELRRVYAAHGPRAVFGGSYGWASAGRFHDAQHQLHRFLNLAGGYVRSVNSYSSGAASVILPHVIGPQAIVAGNNVSWDEMVAESALVLAFGGMALKNNDVGGGGTSQHIARDRLAAARRRGVEFHLIGPLRDDLSADGRGGLASDPAGHRRRADARPRAHAGQRGTARPRAFSTATASAGRGSRRICSAATTASRRTPPGRPRSAAFRPTKSSRWRAASPAGARSSPARCRCSAPSTASSRSGWRSCWRRCSGRSGCRAAASPMRSAPISNTGKPPLAVPLPTVPTGRNSIADFIPVARIADMLLQPGEAFDYDGQRLTYPDIRLVYWAGGNPFHHHQDLGRLRRAFCRPDTVIVHESAWTATARHADIVLPATITLEREDIGAHGRRPAAGRDAPRRRPLRRGARRPRHLHRAGRAARFCRRVHRGPLGRGNGSNTCTSRPAARWPSAASTRRISPNSGKTANLSCRPQPWDGGPIRAFRRDPDGAPLPTPSGRIEIASADDRRLRLRRLPRPSRPGCRRSKAPASPAASRFPLQLDRQPAGDAAAQPARFRRDQPRVEGRRARAGAHPSRTTPRRAASPTATSCGSTTIAAPASPVRC